MCISDGHFEYIIHFLTTRTMSKGYSIQQKKELVVRVENFSVFARQLYKMGNDEILRRYVPNAHGRPMGGHYAGIETAHKVLRAGLWCPNLH